MDANSSELDRYLAWLDTEMRNSRTYHDHKETMAWTATAFYLGGSITLVGVFGSNSTSAWRWVVALLLVLVAASVALFVGMQLQYRSIAADEMCALRRARVKLLAGDIDFEDRRMMGVDDQPVGKDLPKWPGFVVDELGRCEKARGSAREALAADGSSLTSPGWGRARSEIATYALLTLVTVVLIVALFIEAEA